MMKPKLTLSIVIVAMYLETPIFAMNKMDSGVVISLSGGGLTSKAHNYEINTFGYSWYSFPIKSGGAGEVSVGYRLAFGEKDKWNEFYFGVATSIGIYGNMITNPSSRITYNQGAITHYGGKLFFGKYWKSPFYTEFDYRAGGTSDGSIFNDLSLRAGFDVSNNVSIFNQFTIGAQANAYSRLFASMFYSSSYTFTSYSSYQLGLQFRF